MKAALSVALLILALPLAAQEVFVHPIPPGCISVTVPATPTTAGSVTITCPALHIVTPVILPKATENSPYSANLATLARPTGGVAPYTYTLNATNPVPPAWLKLSITGIVTGTPNATGTVIFSFSVSDSSAKLTQAGQGSLNVKREPPHMARGSFQSFSIPVGWYDPIHCSGSECGTLGHYKPEDFAFAQGEPNPWWFLTLRGSGLKTMRSTNAR